MLLLAAVGCPRKHPIFTLSPSSMLFSANEGGSAPSDQLLTMTGIDDIPERGATWSLFSDQPWLTVTPTSGLLHADEAIVLTVHADPSGLPANLYSGEITLVAHYGKHTYPATFQVTFDVIVQSPPPIVIPPPEEVEEVEEELASGLPDEDESFRKELPARICFSGSRR